MAHRGSVPVFVTATTAVLIVIPTGRVFAVNLTHSNEIRFPSDVVLKFHIRASMGLHGCAMEQCPPQGSDVV